MNKILARVIYHEKHRLGLCGKPDALTPCQRNFDPFNPRLYPCDPAFRLKLAIWGVEV